MFTVTWRYGAQNELSVSGDFDSCREVFLFLTKGPHSNLVFVRMEDGVGSYLEEWKVPSFEKGGITRNRHSVSVVHEGLVNRITLKCPGAWYPRKQILGARTEIGWEIIVDTDLKLGKMP